MKIQKKIFITGEIEAKTGLHIGSKDIGMSIGSTENTVIRHPITQEPYIPGSSLRGKMRSLIERVDGKFGSKPMSDEVKNGPYIDDLTNVICKLFGVPAEKASEGKKPCSRLIVRDCILVQDNQKGSAKWLRDAKYTDMPYTEVKTEVVIDRITSAAMPRQLERVPAGTRFEIEMVINLWDDDTEDDEKEYISKLFQGFMLLQDDYLGGHGSRGSGKVKIGLLDITQRVLEDYKNCNQPQSYSLVTIPDELKMDSENANM